MLLAGIKLAEQFGAQSLVVESDALEVVQAVLDPSEYRGTIECGGDRRLPASSVDAWHGSNSILSARSKWSRQAAHAQGVRGF